MQQALAAGKHVLSQKPFALDVGVGARARRGGRAPRASARGQPERSLGARLADRDAARRSRAPSGEVCAVTHLYEHDFDWTLGDWPDELEHFVIYDFSAHWIDITRCWLDGKTPVQRRALEYRNPAQPAESKAPWGAWILFEYEDGSSAAIRSVGTATAAPGNPFWIHGTEGTIRGSVRKGTDFVELERAGASRATRLEGDWIPDGFAGTMGELCSAIAEDREPFNSGRHNLLSLEMTLAACRSAELDGAPCGRRGR